MESARSDANLSPNGAPTDFILALCLAALRRFGYRAENRYIIFQVLPHTLGLGPEVWRVRPSATRSGISANTKAI